MFVRDLLETKEPVYNYVYSILCMYERISVIHICSKTSLIMPVNVKRSSFVNNRKGLPSCFRHFSSAM